MASALFFLHLKTCSTPEANVTFGSSVTKRGGDESARLTLDPEGTEEYILKLVSITRTAFSGYLKIHPFPCRSEMGHLGNDPVQHDDSLQRRRRDSIGEECVIHVLLHTSIFRNPKTLSFTVSSAEKPLVSGP
ncbi:hypothetical protein CEXT_768601 [Caerostris extrusa]|uniref:Uncharacterized protein n=1 Tax=Caerostris extrusa TaxID=172846 RepID=A0AAV4RI93_CAEEX|nr:hypothetical protein CEXT_768601 [Caerostris extrusa]